jgi:large subunit ribosomal protein L21
MFAVIQTGGKQYVVKEGDQLSVEKLDVEAGQTVLFDRVLLIEEGERTLIGAPVLETAVVKAQVIENYKDDKILVFKKIRRKQYRRTRGHRQPLTKVAIVKIFADKSGVPAEEMGAAVAPIASKTAAKPAPKPKAAKKPAPAAEPALEAKPKKAAKRAKAPKAEKAEAKPKPKAKAKAGAKKSKK